MPPAATQHAEALKARLAKVHVEVHGGKLSTSKIVLDDTPLGEKDADADVDVDPGPHVVEVRDAGGKVTFHKEVTLTEKGSDRVTVLVGDAEEAPPKVPIATAAPSRVPAYATGVAGLALLAGSGVFFALRATNINTIAASCAGPGYYTNCTCQPEPRQPGAGLQRARRHLPRGGHRRRGDGDGALLRARAQEGCGGSTATGRDGGTPRPPAASIRVVPTGTGLRVIGAFLDAEGQADRRYLVSGLSRRQTTLSMK